MKIMRVMRDIIALQILLTTLREKKKKISATTKNEDKCCIYQSELPLVNVPVCVLTRVESLNDWCPCLQNGEIQLK